MYSNIAERPVVEVSDLLTASLASLSTTPDVNFSMPFPSNLIIKESAAHLTNGKDI